MDRRIKVITIAMMVLAFFCLNSHAAEKKFKWNVSNKATGYKILYGTSIGTYPNVVDVGNVTEYALSNFSLNAGTTYYFIIRAYNDEEESQDSDLITYTVPASEDKTPPSYPSGVALALQGTSIKCTWQAVSAQDLAGYKVHYGLQSRVYGPSVPVGNVTQYLISGLDAGKKYYVAVTAVDTSDNESAWSTPEVSIDLPIIVDSAPSIAISSPVSTGSYTSTTSSVTLSGTASDDKGITQVKWSNSLGGNGIATGTGSWSTGAIPLLEGTNTISVTAYDTASKTASANIQVLYQAPDTQKPVVTVTYPTTGTTYTTTQEPTSFSGMASDNKAVSKVTWTNTKTGEAGTGTGTSNWSIDNVHLVSGINSITITAHDTAGNQGSKTIEVTLNATKEIVADTEKPVIVLVSPTSEPDYISTAGVINLAGTVKDNNIVSKVTWLNSKTGESGTSIVDGSKWSVSSLTLAPDNNLLVITAYDEAGNKAAVNLSVAYYAPDTEKPVVLLKSPTTDDVYSTDQASVSLGGTASDNKGVSKVIWSNARTGGSGASSGTSAWSISNIILMEGDNPITISAQDNAGNTGTYSITVTYRPVAIDTVLPSISLGFPVTGATYSSSVTPITLAGSASDNMGISEITWSNSAGGSGAAIGTTSWTIENVGLKEGSNVIVITASDTAGNKSAHTITVTYKPLDTQKPVISLLSPTTGTTYDTNAQTITLSGTAADNVGVKSVTWTNTNGTFGTASGTTSWTVSNIGLQVGLNTIVVTAEDAADNKSAHSLTVNYTLPTPVAIDTPTDTQTPETEPAPAPTPAPETTITPDTQTGSTDSGTTRKQDNRKRRNTVTNRFLRLFGIGL